MAFQTDCPTWFTADVVSTVEAAGGRGVWDQVKPYIPVRDPEWDTGTKSEATRALQRSAVTVLKTARAKEATRWCSAARVLVPGREEEVRRVSDTVAGFHKASGGRGWFASKEECGWDREAIKSVSGSIRDAAPSPPESTAACTTTVTTVVEGKPQEVCLDRTVDNANFVLLRHALKVSAVLGGVPITTSATMAPYAFDNQLDEELRTVAVGDVAAAAPKTLSAEQEAAARAAAGDSLLRLLNTTSLNTCSLSDGARCEDTRREQLRLGLDFLSRDLMKKAMDKCVGISMCSAEDKLEVVTWCRHQAENLVAQAGAAMKGQLLESEDRLRSVADYVLQGLRHLAAVRDVVLEWVDWTLPVDPYLGRAYVQLANEYVHSLKNVATAAVTAAAEHEQETAQAAEQAAAREAAMTEQAAATQADLTEQITKLEAIVQAQKDTLVNAKKTVRQLQKRRQEQDTRIAEQEAELGKLRSALQHMNATKEALGKRRAENKDLQRQLQLAQDRAAADAALSQATLAEQQRLIDTLRGSAGEQGAELARLHAEHVRQMGTVSDLTQQVEEAKTHATALQADLAAARRQQEASAAQVEALTSGIAKVATGQDRLKRAVKDAIRSVRDRVQTAKEASDALRAKVVAVVAAVWERTPPPPPYTGKPVDLTVWPFEHMQTTAMTGMQAQWLKVLQKAHREQQDAIQATVTPFFKRIAPGVISLKAVNDLRPALEALLGVTFTVPKVQIKASVRATDAGEYGGPLNSLKLLGFNVEVPPEYRRARKTLDALMKSLKTETTTVTPSPDSMTVQPGAPPCALWRFYESGLGVVLQQWVRLASSGKIKAPSSEARALVVAGIDQEVEKQLAARYPPVSMQEVTNVIAARGLTPSPAERVTLHNGLQKDREAEKVAARPAVVDEQLLRWYGGTDPVLARTRASAFLDALTGFVCVVGDLMRALGVWLDQALTGHELGVLNVLLKLYDGLRPWKDHTGSVRALTDWLVDMCKWALQTCKPVRKPFLNPANAILPPECVSVGLSTENLKDLRLLPVQLYTARVLRAPLLHQEDTRSSVLSPTVLRLAGHSGRATDSVTGNFLDTLAAYTCLAYMHLREAAPKTVQPVRILGQLRALLEAFEPHARAKEAEAAAAAAAAAAGPGGHHLASFTHWCAVTPEGKEAVANAVAGLRVTVKADAYAAVTGTDTALAGAGAGAADAEKNELKRKAYTRAVVQRAVEAMVLDALEKDLESAKVQVAEAPSIKKQEAAQRERDAQAAVVAASRTLAYARENELHSRQGLQVLLPEGQEVQEPSEEAVRTAAEAVLQKRVVDATDTVQRAQQKVALYTGAGPKNHEAQTARAGLAAAEANLRLLTRVQNSLHLQ